MLLTTRDAQRERRNSMYLASALMADRVSMADRLSIAAYDNRSFRADSMLDIRTPTVQRKTSNFLSVPTAEPIANQQQRHDGSLLNQTTNQDSTVKKKYQWKMTHFFFIHLALFILNALLGGLIVYLIENHSSEKNQLIEVSFIDAWFVSSTCVYSCGLTTLDFANLSRASQGVLMFLTFISGITISTLPALLIKAYSHRSVKSLRVDDDQDPSIADDDENDELPTVKMRNRKNLPDSIRKQLKTLPNVVQLRYRAYITCIILTLFTCLLVYSIGFIAIGSWLTAKYTPNQLMQSNKTVNPWYISFVVTLTGFNQNGLVPFSDGFSRFVNDAFLNIFVMLVVMFGTSLFPFLLRNVVLLIRLIVPWRHKVIFDYIVINNHRLSTLLFPAVQTRIYLLVTMVLYTIGVGISLILDLNNQPLQSYSSGTRVLIFFFHTVNARFAGFNTTDINYFSRATLLVYLVLMGTKPQMLCAIDESPFELSWLALQARDQVAARTSLTGKEKRPSIGSILSRDGSISSLSSRPGALPIKQMEQFLRRQSFMTKDLARQQFANVQLVNGNESKPEGLKALRARLFLVYFVRALFQHAFSFFILTRTWLFFFIFLICAIEYRRMEPVDPNFTVFKVIFEIISAFGAVGLSLGYPGVPSSFATILSPVSKVIVMMTMLMGRHRGLLASMKDQEVIEHSAADLLDRRRDDLIHRYEQKQLEKNNQNEENIEYRIDRF